MMILLLIQEKDTFLEFLLYKKDVPGISPEHLLIIKANIVPNRNIVELRDWVSSLNLT